MWRIRNVHIQTKKNVKNREWNVILVLPANLTKLINIQWQNVYWFLHLIQIFVLIAFAVTVAIAEDVESITENDAAEPAADEEQIFEEPEEPQKAPARGRTAHRLDLPAHKPDLSAHKPDKDAKIKTKSQSSDLEGNYQYQFESSNGIAANEAGVAGQVVQGSTTWIAKNGEALAISFVADENGYRPTGYHLPTPPPIPYAIQRALAHLATKKPDPYDNYDY